MVFLDEDAVSEIESRVTLSVRATLDHQGYEVCLQHWAEDRRDTVATFPLTDAQQAVVREFWARVRGRRGQ